MERILGAGSKKADAAPVDPSSDPSGALLTLIKRWQSRWKGQLEGKEKFQNITKEQGAALKEVREQLAAAEKAVQDLAAVKTAAGLKDIRLQKETISSLSATIMGLQEQLQLAQRAGAAAERQVQELEKALDTARKDFHARSQQLAGEIERLNAEVERLVTELDPEPTAEDANAVPLVETFADGSYHIDFRTALHKFCVEFDISGNRLSPLIHGVLALITGLPLDDVKSRVRLPSASTIYRDTVILAELMQELLRLKLPKGTPFALAWDAGDAGKATHLPILIYFYGPECVEQICLSIPRLEGKTATDHVTAILRVLNKYGLILAYMVGAATDATNVNPKTVKDLEELKADMVRQCKPVGKHCFEHTEALYPHVCPAGIVWLPDITHGFKNGELQLTRTASEAIRCILEIQPAAEVRKAAETVGAAWAAGALAPAAADAGSGGAGKKRASTTADHLSDALMSLGRLFSHYGGKLAKVFTKLCKDAKLPKPSELPAEIGHRFNIKTKIAACVMGYFDQLLEALYVMAEDASGLTEVFSGAEGDRSLKHVREVLSYLLDPTIRLHLACLAALAPAAEASYSRFNVNGGCLVHRVLTLLEQTVADYERIAKNLKTPGTVEFSEFTAWAWQYYAECFGVRERGKEWLELNWDTDCPMLRRFKADLDQFCVEGIKSFR